MNSSAADRRTCDPALTWALTDLFPTDDAWRAELSRVRGLLPALAAYQGRLGESAATLLAFLPESVTSAMANYILPSLFGACFASMAVKKLKIALYALPMAIILRLLGVPAWITIVCCIFGTILITYFLYKKKLIK